MPRGLVCCVKMSEEELRRKEDVLRMAQMTSGGDSISVKKLDLSDTYSVGINLEKALQNPGSDYDMVLREGDMLLCSRIRYSQDQWCCDVS